MQVSTLEDVNKSQCLLQTLQKRAWNLP